MRLCSLTLTILFLSSCSPDDSLSVRLSDLEQVRFDPGYHFDAAHLSNGLDVPFVTYSPGVSPTSKLPLIIVLHGGGQYGTYQGEGVLKSLFRPGLQDQRAIFIAPTAVSGHWASPNSLELIDALVNGIKRAGWPIDPDKIVIAGYSAGAIGAWYITGSAPDLVKAGIAVAGDPVAGSLQSGDTLVPLFVIHGREDEVFPFDDAESEVSALINAGAPYVFYPMDGLSHTALAAYVPGVAEASLWLATILQ
ncbi:MAG: dienelactone hydrolase family protein [Bacteroidetes bacterium]|nr:dienelactone hydrolase family protein [Bacteroidota bacterium]